MRIYGRKSVQAGAVLLALVAAGGRAVHGQELIVPGSYAYTGAPFIARIELRWDGTEQNPAGVRKRAVMRDSSGRERFEYGTGPAMTVTLYDPTEGRLVRLDAGAKVARVTELGARAPETMAANAAKTPLLCHVGPGWASLGTREIAGLEACGQRHDDREFWRSTKYRMPVAETKLDARYGRFVDRIVEFKAVEPDPGLFVVPEGYEVKVEGPPLPQPAPGPGVERIGDGVSAPVLLKTAEPEFADEARAVRINGSVLVYLVVDEDGLPTRLRVLHGIGYGLDEKALDAVRKYTFRPGMKDGKAVKVEMSVEVPFRDF